MIGVESYIVFFTACFFTFLYVTADRNWKKFWGIIASVPWYLLGVLWLFLSYEPMETGGTTYSTHVIGMFYVGIGIVFTILVIADWIGELRLKRLGETGDDWSLP